MPTQPYRLADGTRVSGVTTILSNCKLGGIEPLLHWANQEGLAGRNYRDSRGKAADAGTCAHLMVECHIRGKDFATHPDAQGFTPDVREKAAHAYKAFEKWAKQTKLTPTETEVSLVSEKYKYGGTLDAMLVDGKLSLGDWKTSGAVYPEHLLQLAGYWGLWAENRPQEPITGGFHLIRFGKPSHPDDPVTFEHRYWDNLDFAWQTFLKIRDLYDATKRLKGMV